MSAPPRGTPPIAVLVEGRSDVAAVTVMFTDAGITADDAEVVDVGGVTNFRTVWTSRARQHGPDRVAGLCDAGEVGHLFRPLTAAGRIAATVEDLNRLGFFVCDRDLEDELIRALGPDRAREAVDSAGIGGAFEVLTRQPQWAGRPLADQLRRFAGAGSGRKELLAAAWMNALAPDERPTPLRALTQWVLNRIALSGSERP